ncbi:hypothetical protein [Jongsikchunia kroppenstedtii]|uniref:hypothetical protein n=1 Tax=Jongsikchunia kroppenstedtii TaxID=1121721 RepID=UPI00038029EF|nr:hypothetical protein [Jongsikchunia kroppenstedtii]
MAEQSRKFGWAEERERRLEYLDELPGKDHHERFETLNRTSKLFSANGQELHNHLATFVGTPKHVRDLPDDFEDEAIRLLHNYIASVATLRDIQRATHRKVWPTRIPEAERNGKDDHRTIWEVQVYTPKVTDMFGDDDIKFLFDLRNCTLHHTVPVLSIGTRWRHVPPAPVEWINSVELKRDELEKFSKWTKPALRFIETQEKNVAFLPLLEKYSTRAREFSGWFWDQVKEAVFQEVNEFHSKSNEFRGWLSEELVEPDWDDTTGNPVPGSLRRNRAVAHAKRCEFGTTGWGGIAVDSAGVATVGESDWEPLPPVRKYRKLNRD